MTHTRREFITTTTAALGASPLFGATGLARTLLQDVGAAPRSLKVLFLGGTGMLGPHTVRRLLDRGHEVTLFNRGNRDEMFPDLELITGNRIITVDPGLEPLRKEVDNGRTWDVVIDTASVHTWVEHSAELLRDAANHDVFTSSMSVYADNSEPGLDEDDEVATMPDDLAATITTPSYNMQYFGAVKARCEAAARKRFADDALVLRPGLIVGPRDFSHRFTYWPWRIRKGGEVLAPGAPDHPVQFIDVRDVANFMVRLIERRTGGIFNVNGPIDGRATMGSMLDACKKATASGARFTWVDGEWLGARNVQMWAHMPVWIPPTEGMRGFHTRDLSKARKAGLTTRPTVETARDTLDWFDNEYLPGFAEAMEERGLPDETFDFGEGQRPGITPQREKRLLEEWHAQREKEG
jgi:2'-hydroxyisoflavone reductase